MKSTSNHRFNKPVLAIFFIVLGMVCISIQDVLIKILSDTFPLHQIIFIRSVIAIAFSISILHFQGGVMQLKTPHFKLHIIRGLLLFIANTCFFCALVTMPLAEATTLFYISPLLITFLSVIILGEKVGFRRILALVVGLFGVLLASWSNIHQNSDYSLDFTFILPLVAALAYALMQVLTRHLGATAPAAVMAIYIQGILIIISFFFWMVLGDGRYSSELNNMSIEFLLRAWSFPKGNDGLLLLGCGLSSAIIGYSMAQAYRVSNPAIIAPFEYVALPLSIMWGWLVWNELPAIFSWFGILLISGAGFYIFFRENQKGYEVALKQFLRKW